MKPSDILGGGVIFLFGAITVVLSAQMPIGTFRAAGSGLFPLCLGLLLMALSAAFVAKGLLSAEKDAGTDAHAAEEPGLPLPVIAFLAIMAGTTLLLKPFGYLAVSFLLMVGLLRLLGSKRWPLNLALSLLTAAASHMLFVYLLKIPLPRGVLGI
ncbi:MAG: tripartite tricarboxylate transporter TctB family protein [Desulfomonile tiedjei]|nr:tripartite tricarboxylate transporter TctB family protein [Desulfomonile tiedjei]